jgi:hypothetical protein
MSEDPLGFAAGDTNLYRYVGNSYPNASDPTGHILFTGGLIRWLASDDDVWMAIARDLDGLTGGASTDYLTSERSAWIEDASNFGAGVGDTVSFGLTGLARRGLGYDDVVHYDSAAYRYGTYTGTGINIALAVANPLSAARSLGRAAAWSATRGLAGAAARSAGRRAFAGAVARAAGRLALPQGGKALVGAAHQGVAAYLHGGSTSDIVQASVTGGVYGLVDPTWGTLTSAAGAAAGYAVGRYLGGERGALLGMDVGAMAGGLAGSAHHGWKHRQGTSHGRWYTATKSVAPDVVGMGVGAGLGYAATGTWEGALGGAQHGQAVAGFAVQVTPGVREWLLKACFAAGTPLLTAEGSKPIEEIRVGDRVLSRPEGDVAAPVQAMVVEEVFVRTGRIWVLKVGGRVIRTTGEHPFREQSGAWVPVSGLRPGDLLRTRDGRWLPVEEVYDTGEYGTVYNLRVAEYHTYFVGCQEWGFSVWAHNAYIGTAEELAARNRIRTHMLRAKHGLGEGKTITPARETPLDPVAVQKSIRRHDKRLQKMTSRATKPEPTAVEVFHVRSATGKYTEPTLPPTVIATGGGLRVEHYTRAGDHVPAHVHIKAKGVNIKIGANGRAIDVADDTKMTPAQRDLVADNLPIIRSAVNKIKRWYQFQHHYIDQ